MEKKNVYQEITDRMISILESGVCPWKKPFKDSEIVKEFPRNFKSKKLYRGINCWILHCSPYRSNLWGTYKQLEEAGFQVRKGEKATQVVFWKLLDIENKNESGEIEQDKIPLLKSYYVFNVEQCEGFVEVANGDVIAKEEDKIAECEKLISGFPLGMPEIHHAPGRASYSRLKDVISVPSPSEYDCKEEYYQVFFHECIHATGHKDRLKRETLLNWNYQGDENYSQEELIAELGASFLSGFAGILDKTIENSAAYLTGWVNALRGDNKLIIKAAGQAQKATDYLMGVKFEDA